MASRKTRQPASKPPPPGSGRRKPDPVSYRDAGVDLSVYADAMKRLPALMQRTRSPRVVKNDGGFAGLFALDSGHRWQKRNYRDPLLVSGTDGVGTKLQLARKVNRHDTIGIDLVAMCVNDTICCGAEPLFFLDYIAMSHDDPERLEQIVQGISDGCLAAGTSLLGGETAIMPGTYRRGDYDVAGFQVGVVERRQLIDGSRIAEGDAVIGLASSGIHSNGFSLVRKIVFDVAGLKASTRIPELDERVGDCLLTPTRIYVDAVASLMSDNRLRPSLHGIAHITGGGIAENIERILPKAVDLELQGGSWKIPPVFPWLKQLGSVRPAEMYRVFNMGLGLVIVLADRVADRACRRLQEAGYECGIVGRACRGTGRVRINRRRTR